MVFGFRRGLRIFNFHKLLQESSSPTRQGCFLFLFYFICGSKAVFMFYSFITFDSLNLFFFLIVGVNLDPEHCK